MAVQILEKMSNRSLRAKRGNLFLKEESMGWPCSVTTHDDAAAHCPKKLFQLFRDKEKSGGRRW
jgi:hypothetical protein